MEEVEEVTSMPDSRPMAVETDPSFEKKNKGWFGELFNWRGSTSPLLPYQKLAADSNARELSLLALRFTMAVTAANQKILLPNYAIMASPNASKDSFDNTDPFDFNSATYFIPMTGQLGVAIASMFTGQLSDKAGRKNIILLSTVVAAIGSIVKYFLRKTFWGFCVANFCTGLATGSLPVAMAYVGDVFASNAEIQSEMSVMVGLWMLGGAGGGILAILLESTGLFAPLWLAAGLMFVAAIALSRFFIEPGDLPALEIEPNVLDEDEEDEDIVAPEEVDQCALWNIVGGSFLDNVGSQALFPLCLSPLAWNQYYLNFVNQGQDPIMSLTAYKWLSVMVAVMIVPSSLASPKIFEKMGVAAACVLGNVCTAVITIALLLIGNGPATPGFFAFFIVVMYCGYPFTVISQLTTGPMLDMIAPPDKRGYVQGINSTVMNGTIAIAPWLIGLLADAAGTNAAIWAGIGVSFFAGLVNSPLMFRKGFGRKPKKLPPELRPLVNEDKDLVEKILQGEYVDPHLVNQINWARMEQGKPLIVVHPKEYSYDRDHLKELKHRAVDDFRSRRAHLEEMLSKFSDPEFKNELPDFCEKVNRSLTAEPETIDQVHSELGQWIGDYLKDSGYQAQFTSTLIKEMVLSAFPPISTDGVRPDNLEETLLKLHFIYSEYLALKDSREYTRQNVLGSGARYAVYG